MKLQAVLDMVDKIKPGNPYDVATKVQWLNELEGDIQSRLLKTAPQEIIQYTEYDLEETLLVPVPFDKVYWMWVAAMIDFANGEYQKYQNTLQMVNDAYDKYAKWFHRNFHEDTGGFLYIGGTTKYGLSAYEIAMNHGFEGSEEEWLESLRGYQGIDGPPGAGLNIVDQVATEADLPTEGLEPGVGYFVGMDADALLFVWNGEEWFFKLSIRGKPGEDGYTPQKGVDYVDGRDGKDGHTPVRGVDYWTDADQKAVSDAVSSANTAASAASSAAAKANAAASGADDAVNEANSAANSANAAAGNATTAANNANTAAENADNAAASAGQAASAANTAAGNANAAKDAANNAASAANTAAGNAGTAASNAQSVADEVLQARANGEFDGKDGVSASHEWNGTRLRMTSASGTSEVDLKGEPGTGITILGSYVTEEALRAAHATGKPGDGYMVSGDLYVWSEEKNDWDNVGRIKGEPGQDGYTPVKGVDYWTEAEQKAVSDAVSAANTAAGAANTAASNAETAAGGANAAAQTANNAAGSANQAAGAAATAAGNANTAAGNANTAAEEIRQARENGEFDGKDGKDGYTPVKDKDYFDGKDGHDGKDGTSVTVSSVTESTVDGGTNVVNFSDGKKLNVKNGSKGSKGDKGDPYTLTDTDKDTIAAAVKASLTKENWTFTLEDGSTVTKAVYVG